MDGEGRTAAMRVARQVLNGRSVLKMQCLVRPWGHMHFSDIGPRDAPAVLWATSLGTDLRMWDDVTGLLPGLRHVRFDKRGHGLSATPGAPWDVTDLADDAAALLDHLGIGRVVVGGCSVGGMIAQAFAIARPERTRALVLSNTAARIGTLDLWAQRIAAVQAGGMAAIADAVMERWFAPGFRASDAARPWRTMLLRCDPAGYAGTCGALSRADLRAQVGRIAAPVLMLAGVHDLATPPDLVAGTAAMIAGARMVTLPGSGHIPAIDAPAATAAAIATFVEGLTDD